MKASTPSQERWTVFFGVLVIVAIVGFYTAPLWLMLAALPQKFWIWFAVVFGPVLIGIAGAFDKPKGKK